MRHQQCIVGRIRLTVCVASFSGHFVTWQSDVWQNLWSRDKPSSTITNYSDRGSISRIRQL